MNRVFCSTIPQCFVMVNVENVKNNPNINN